jgi:hypothetical protein
MMPRGDGTRPVGLGPMTGRAAKHCRGYVIPDFVNPTFGCGFGRGGGRGLHRGFWDSFPGFAVNVAPMLFYQAYPVSGTDQVAEARMLENQITMVEQSLKNAKERLNELQKGKE